MRDACPQLCLCGSGGSQAQHNTRHVQYCAVWNAARQCVTQVGRDAYCAPLRFAFVRLDCRCRHRAPPRLAVCRCALRSTVQCSAVRSNARARAPPRSELQLVIKAHVARWPFISPPRHAFDGGLSPKFIALSNVLCACHCCARAPIRSLFSSRVDRRAQRTQFTTRRPVDLLLPTCALLSVA